MKYITDDERIRDLLDLDNWEKELKNKRDGNGCFNNQTKRKAVNHENF